MLSALRGVATEAWRLGLMDGDTRARIVDVDGVKGTSIPAGRSLAGGELHPGLVGAALLHANAPMLQYLVLEAREDPGGKLERQRLDAGGEVVDVGDEQVPGCP